ncbi:MAG: hypothetical protein JWO99_501 [Candidatus Saccharibacteria bacterium]|nr:hypothetical protein [Candidatus Saccharibacteria bacterium]
MIDTLQKVLTDSNLRSSQAVEAKLAEKSDVETPWFD